MRAAACLVLLQAAWLMLGPARAAAPADPLQLAQQACGQAGPMPEPAAEFVGLLRQNPAAALAVACASLRHGAGAAPDLPDATLAVTEALAAASRSDEATALLDALQQQRDPAGAAPAWAARWYLARATVADERGERAGSAVLFGQARAALEAAGQSRSVSQALALLGQASAWYTLRAAGDLARADAALDEAATLLESLDRAQSLWMSDVLNLRSNLAYARQDLPGTLYWARAELALMQRIGPADDPELLHTLTTIGAVLMQQGRLDAAQAAFEQGLAIIERHPQAEPYGQQGIYSNLALLHFQRGRSIEALPLAERSLQLSRQAWGARAARTVLPLTVRAEIEADLSLYSASRRSYELALELAREHAGSLGPLRLLRVHEGYAGVLLVLGDADAARARLDEALQSVAAADGQLGYWRGRALRRRAALAAREGKWPQAEADLAEAEPLIASAIGARHPYVLVLRAEHCFAQIETHAAASSCAALQGLQDVLDEASPRQRFAVRAALAAAAEASGKTQAAREDHLLALAAALDVGGPDPRWSAYDALARHLRRHGERAEAVLIAKQSVAQIEAMRADLAADAGRHERGFLSDKQGVYLRLADWLTEDGRIDEALQVLRMLKREEFFDFVQRDGGLADPGSTPEALLFSAAERQGLAPWIGAPAATPAREGAEPPSAAEREAWRSLARTEAARVRSWQTLLSRLPDPAVASAPPAAAATRPGPPDQPTPPDPAVAPGELRAWIYPGEAHLNLVLASPRGRELRRLPSEPAALARAIGRLLGSIGRREPVDDQLRALHALLGAPLVQAADQAGAQRLVLQVTGVLRYLPFAALTDGQHALGERLAIEQRVDAAEAGPPASRPARAGSVRAFGVTRAVNGMAALPALAREVCGIVDGPVFGLAENDAACAPGSGALPGKAWLNERFTLAELGLASAGLPGQHDLLHLGTHFMLRPGQMSRSWLLLGDGQRLGLDQLATLDFSGQDLVTLSACETGLGGADGTARGQEVEGLNLLVMRRGARAVLASLWRVEDTSTGLLMREFYRGLARRADPAQALRQAQRAVRLAEGGRYAEPFYWAGFYLATRR